LAKHPVRLRFQFQILTAFDGVGKRAEILKEEVYVEGVFERFASIWPNKDFAFVGDFQKCFYIVQICAKATNIKFDGDCFLGHRPICSKLLAFIDKWRGRGDDWMTITSESM
jgi:hypothetical protein